MRGAWVKPGGLEASPQVKRLCGRSLCRTGCVLLGLIESQGRALNKRSNVEIGIGFMKGAYSSALWVGISENPQRAYPGLLGICPITDVLQLLKGRGGREAREMSKKTRNWLKIVLVIGLILLVATPTFTRTITMKEVAASAWIFLVFGALIVGVQLIPAAILFLSFVGIACAVVFKKYKKTIS